MCSLIIFAAPKAWGFYSKALTCTDVFLDMVIAMIIAVSQFIVVLPYEKHHDLGVLHMWTHPSRGIFGMEPWNHTP